MLIFALVLSQAELFRRSTGRGCLLLVDDLPAELDGENRGRLLSLLADLPVQALITSIDPVAVMEGGWASVRRFRLECGALLPFE